jgi:uncharacterized caspase-like protein
MKTWLVLLAIAVFCGPAHAGTAPTALVVGVSSYENGPDLPNAGNDARVVAASLRALGFKTLLLLDPDRAKMLRTLAQLRVISADASQVVIYFSGHGASLQDESYLFLRDTDMRAERLQQTALPMRVLVRAISDQPRQKVIFLDACRENPLQGANVRPIGALQVPPAGLFVAYATQPGQIAYDGAGPLSPFARALVSQLRAAPRPIEEMMRRLRVQVIRQTGGQQIPWSRSSLLSQVVLGASPRSAPAPE